MSFFEDNSIALKDIPTAILIGSAIMICGVFGLFVMKVRVRGWLFFVPGPFTRPAIGVYWKGMKEHGWPGWPFWIAVILPPLGMIVAIVGFVSAYGKLYR